MEPYQRLLLANQYKILALLEPESAEQHREKENVLREGYEYEYERTFELSEELSTEECRFVIAVFDLHRAFHLSVNALPPEDQPPADDWTFAGFDVNNEGSYKRYASFLLRKPDKWPGVVAGSNGECPHSGSQVVPMYKRRLEVWRNLGGSYQMDKKTLDEVLAA